MGREICYHCGNTCKTNQYSLEGKNFCCSGCKTVYQLLTEHDMSCYYDLENNPGTIPTEILGKYDYLDDNKIKGKLLDFQEDDVEIVTFYIPHIHCSSCIWMLENLHKLNNKIHNAVVNFPNKTVKITYNPKEISLKNVVVLLNTIGYDPYISLENIDAKSKYIDRSLIYKLGVSGFAFGNVMFLSFPEYFEVSEYWLEEFKHLFRYLMFAFTLPVVLYSANDYFTSAYKGLRSKILNIDIPISIGILVLFIRSSAEIFLDIGTGFFDSLTGLVFFLLLGKFFQQKTYSFLSFERDYKSYFPIAVTKVKDGVEESVEVYDIKEGDRLLIRNEELIPVDGILIKSEAYIDYSFVTGESKPVSKSSGDKLFAGGKQLGSPIEMKALSSVSQSYLTQLWSNDVFNKQEEEGFKPLTDGISKYFTIAVLLIAFLSTSFWMYYDSSLALSVFTAVLIIACPCAIALAAPFTLGNILRVLGNDKIYLKNAYVIEKLAAINTLVFDKTGTITSTKQDRVLYKGKDLSHKQKALVKSVLRGSNHPLSRKLYDDFKEEELYKIHDYEEHTGKGILATVKGTKVKIGSSSWVKSEEVVSNFDTTVHVSLNNSYKGEFVFKHQYRKGLSKLFNRLSKSFDTYILSGDNDGEKKYLQSVLPNTKGMFFNQKPESKLNFIKELQEKHSNVLMVGDGLNDSGAFAKSNVGVAISEDINVFSPACDIILDASKFSKILNILSLAKKAIKVIKWAFVISFFYNVIGLYFAVTGQLQPIVAAILMPLSSISIVVFTTIASNLISKKL